MYRILVIHNILWSHYKGTVFSRLYDLCKLHGYDFRVIQIAATENTRLNIGEIDYNLHAYPYHLLHNGSFSSISFFKKVMKFKQEISEYKPDLVVLPGYYDLSFWLLLLFLKLRKTPVILTLDSTFMDKSRVWYKEVLKRFFVAQCDAAFGYGTKSREYLIQLGMPEKSIFIRCQATDNQKITSIYNSVKINRKKYSHQFGYKPFNFIYVGRLSQEKNVELLIKTFTALKLQEPLATDWGLIVVGDGPIKSYLVKKRVPDIYFTGGKNWEEVPVYYALADVLVLPSISEPWGLVVNEAMACGLPVIVSDRCGSAYDLVVNSTNGFIFNSLEGQDLFDKMTFFVTHPECIHEMGRRSNEIINEYTPENAAIQMCSGIRHVLIGRNK